MQDVVSNPRKVSADRRTDGMENSMKTAEMRSHSSARGLNDRALSPDDSESRYTVIVEEQVQLIREVAQI